MTRTTFHLLMAMLMAALAQATLPEMARAQWSRTGGPEGAYFNAVAADDSVIMASTGQAGLIRYHNGGWEELSAPRIFTFALVRRIALAGLTGGRILRSTDYGATWDPLATTGQPMARNGMFYLFRQDTLLHSEDGLNWIPGGKLPASYAPAGDDDALYLLGGVDRDTLLRSTDHGASWSVMPGNLRSITGVNRTLASGHGALYLFDHTRTLYRSIDGGQAWSAIMRGLPDTAMITWVADGDGALWAGSYKECYRLAGDTWVGVNVPSLVWTQPVARPEALLLPTQIGPYVLPADESEPISIVSGLRRTSVSALAADGDLLVAGTSFGRVFRSTSAGVSWEEADTLDLRRLAFDRGALIGFGNNSAWRSLDSGLTWEPLADRLDSASDFTAMAVADGNVYLTFARMGEDEHGLIWVDGGVLRSTDRGATWTRRVNGLPTQDGVTVPVRDIAVNGATVVIGTSAGIYRSTNRGESWEKTTAGLPDDTTLGAAPQVLAAGGRFYLQSDNTIYMSTDGGAIWGSTMATFPEIRPLGVRFQELNGQVFVQTYDYTDLGVSVFTHVFDGSTWRFGTGEFPGFTFLAPVVSSGGRTFAGSTGYGVWQYDGPVAGVDRGDRPTRGGIALHPNPATTGVTAAFTLAERGAVRIELVDLLGRHLRTVADATMEAGEHALPIDLADILPGTYFLELTTAGAARMDRIVVR